MTRRLLIALALAVPACSSSEPPPPEKKVEEPTPEPETETPVDAEAAEAADAMKMALLGGGEKDESEAKEEPEPDPVEASKPAPRRTQRRKPKQRNEEPSSQTRLPPSPSLPEPPARLSDAQFESVVGDWRGVKSCVATNRPRGGEVQNGALSVQFTIAGNGAVEAARVEEASGAFAQALAPCVERKAMRLSFPDFGGKEAVTRSAKFVF